jgi:predicted SprT family Zn-dependent metalloprotease
MVGRYGNDEFTMFLLITSLIFTFLGNFRPLKILYFIGLILIFYSLFRSLSKKYEARRKELNWYLRWAEKPKAELKLLVNKIRDRKTHKYFKCKGCKTVLRVPSGRGKIEITCPKCRAKVIKKT